MPDGHLTYRRGEIRWVNLDPSVGAEARKIRSCVVGQNDVGNRHGRLTVVVPLLPGRKRAPYAVDVQATDENGLDQDRFLDLGQIRSVDHSRVPRRVGDLEPCCWPQIRAAPCLVRASGAPCLVRASGAPCLVRASGAPEVVLDFED